jgi:5-methylcytosine-specific restriction endonuclease McrA
VYERDDYTCRRCGRSCISRRDYTGDNGERIIQAHHIGGYDGPEDNNPAKIVTLCARCHGEVEGGGALNVPPDEHRPDG